MMRLEHAAEERLTLRLRQAIELADPVPAVVPELAKTAYELRFVAGVIPPIESNPDSHDG